MKTRSLLWVFLSLLLSLTSMKAQVGSSPSNPVVLPTGSFNQSYTVSDTVVWYKLVNDSASFITQINVLQNGSKFKPRYMELYNGNYLLYVTRITGDTLNYVGDSLLSIPFYQYVAGQTFYVKLVSDQMSCGTCVGPNASVSYIMQNYARPTPMPASACELTANGDMECYLGLLSNLHVAVSQNAYAGCTWKNAVPASGVGFATIDYFHNGAPTSPLSSAVDDNINFATNNLGTNAAHGGQGFSGGFTGAQNYAPYQREYVVEQLATPMVAGQKYYISLWCKLTHYSKYATSDIQVFASTAQAAQSGASVPFLSPASLATGVIIPFNNPIVSDTGNWTRLTACFTPTVNYSWIAIGNFAPLPGNWVDRDPTNAWNYPTNGGAAPPQYHIPGSYYYYDDVSIAPISLAATGGSIACVGSTTLNAAFTCSLNTAGNITYSWLPTTGLSNPNIVNPVASPGATTIYTVTATIPNAFGGSCTATATAQVTYTSLNISPTASPSIICTGGSSTLSVTGANSYTWMPGGSNSSSIVVSPSSTTVYTVTGANGSCTNTRTISVTVVPATGPVTVSASSNSVCLGSNVQLTASGATSYTWNPGNLSGTTVTVSPTANTVYTVTGSSICFASQSATVAIGVSSQTVAASVVYPSSCGSTMTLSATGSTSYTWQPGGLTGTPITVFPSTPTTYTVKGTLPCSSTATVLVNPGIINPVCINTYTGTALTVVAGSTLTVPNGTVYHNYRIVCNGTIVFAPGTSTSGFDASSVLMGPNASIVLPNSSNVSIQNTHIYGCTSMWNGISLPVGNSVFTMGYTLIEDAKTALNVPYATGSNQITLTNNVFNKNNVDIHYVNAAANTITIERNIFASRCTGYNPPLVMVPTMTNAAQYYDQTLANTQFVQPLNNGTVTVTSPSVAIWIDENGTANGNGTLIKFTDANIIDKHQIGIKTIDVNNLSITKQIIMNGMPGVGPFGTPLGKLGIYLSASTASGYKGTITIGAKNAANAIGNMDNGIWVLGGNTEINTKIMYNNITNIANTGISYFNVNTQGNLFNSVVTHTVTHNTIASAKGYGIYCSNAGRTYTRLDSNAVNNTGLIPVSGNTILARGIYVQEVANPANAKYTINGNALSLVVQGVVVNSTKNVTINDNQINMAYLFGGGSQGINLTNCTAPSAKNNVVKGYGWQTSNFYNDNCMAVQDCPQGYYQCNQFDHTLWANVFTGQGIATTLFQNIYDNCNVGVVLGQNGFIDIQDDPTNSTSHQPADNKFQNWGSAFNTFVMTVNNTPGNGNLSPFYIRNNSNFVMPANGAGTASNPCAIFNVTNAALPSAQCSGSLVPRPSDNIPNMLNGGFFADQRAETVSQQELYRFLKSLSPSLLTSGMTTYLSNKSTTSIGYKAQMEDSISSFLDGRAAALTGAMTAFGNWTPQNSVESNQHTFYSYYLSYLSNGNTLSETGRNAIKSIAAGCPYTDGTGVWQARSFTKVLGDTVEYRNTCENLPEIGIPTGKLGFTEAIQDRIYSNLFPNPNDGNFSLKLSKSVNLLNIEVYDVTGRALCSQEFTNVQEAELSCNELKDGMYLVKIFVNGQFLTTYRMAVTH